jgi:hypothetical protein
MPRWWWIGIGVLAAAAIPLTVWLSSLPHVSISVASTPTARPMRIPGDCSAALGQVRQYRAPGQAAPLESVVPRELAADRRPTQVEGWESHGAEGATCVVGFVAWVGNERYHLRWRHYPDSGHVEALDPLTRRISGW